MKSTHARCIRQLLLCLSISCAVLSLAKPARAASPPGDVVGKVTVGYQGWFACTGDGAPIGTWWHWSGTTQPPTPSSLTNQIDCWPDMRHYARGYATAFTNFGNGQPPNLFSSYDDQVVNTHFRWMAENGIDTAALQRFNPFGGEGPTRDAMAVKVMNAAQTYGRKFYIMYDISGWTSFDTQLKNDWTNKIINLLHITSSPAYAMQNGKPVVCIWGMGFTDRPGDAPTCTGVINWFKDQGCYVIGGVPTWWRTSKNDSKTNFLSAYSAFNMISPWMVGRIGSNGDSDSYRANANEGDVAYCNANGIDYQPCVLPGGKNQRLHGNLMWHEFVNMIQIGSHGIYISMFDEFNEGNQIACTAEDASMMPGDATSLYFTLDQDGTHCSSDYYLRLTGDGGKMLKGQIAFTTVRPTLPVLPVAPPVAPANLAAVGGNAQAALNWTAAPRALSYSIKRATVSGGSYSTIATNIGLIGYTDTNLVNGTNYYYVVSTTTAQGESTNSPEVLALPYAAVASANADNPPNETAAKAFDGLTGTKWLTAGNTGWLRYYLGGLAQTVVGYSLTSGNDQPGRDPKNWQFQGSHDGSAWTTLDTRAGETFSARGLTKQYSITNSTAYEYYRLNITANFSNAGNVQLAELAFAYSPVPPVGFTATTISSSEISLGWTPAAGAASYNVKRSGTNGGPYVNIATGITATAYWDKNLTPGTAFFYVVSTVNAGGESTNSLQASATTQPQPPPTIPMGLTAVSGDAAIALSWIPSVGAASYTLKRATVSGGPYTPVANPTATAYTNTGLVNNTTYYYVVSATNAVGASTNSTEVSSLPSAVIALANSENPPSETAAKAFDGSVDTKWLGTGTSGWLQCYFRGIAKVVVRYDVSSANDASGRDPRNWQFQGSHDGSNWTTLDTRTGETFTARKQTKQYPISNAIGYEYCRLNITANNGDANNVQLSELAFATIPGVPPAVPAGLTATAGNNQAVLNWAAVSGAVGYNLKRAPNSNGVYTVIATNLPGLAFTNAGLVNGTVYYFAVSATNSFGESTNSAQVSVRPVSPAVPQLAFGINSGQLQFGWPLDHTGWRLQTQTNAPGIGLGTNWSTVSGSILTNQILVPIDASQGNVFFRLVYP